MKEIISDSGNNKCEKVETTVRDVHQNVEADTEVETEIDGRKSHGPFEDFLAPGHLSDRFPARSPQILLKYFFPTIFNVSRTNKLAHSTQAEVWAPEPNRANWTFSPKRYLISTEWHLE